MLCRLCFISRQELSSILSAAVHWSLNDFGSFIISLSTEVNINSIPALCFNYNCPTYLVKYLHLPDVSSGHVLTVAAKTANQ